VSVVGHIIITVSTSAVGTKHVTVNSGKVGRYEQGGCHLHCFSQKKMAILFYFIPLACAECNNSLPFSGAFSIPSCHKENG
jgi:hypothetical protein